MDPVLLLHQRVGRTISRFGIGPELRIGVAVSGGADSVCLLRVLLALGLPVSVVHINHLLRGLESDGDETFVADLAAELGLECFARRVDVGQLGGNLEEEARRVRYTYFEELIETSAIDRVATGHTLTDQAETVLFRLLRGAHSRGLAGIHAVGPKVIRPLIEITRAEVEQYLLARGMLWRTDSSNEGLDFARNRIRQELMPVLKRDWNPEIERSLAQHAALAFDEEVFWQGRLNQLATEVFQIRGNNILIRASTLLERPVAESRRLIRRAMEQVKGDLHGIGFPHVEGILELARGGEGHGRLQVPGLDVIRSFEWLRFSQLETRDKLADRNYEVEATLDGTAVLPRGAGAIKLEVIDNTEIWLGSEGGWESARVKGALLDLDRVLARGAELRLRTWKPGDQYTRGDAGRVKVKQMFQDERIPLWDRADWPMITAGKQIIWVKQFGPAAEVTANRDTRRILRVREISPREFEDGDLKR